ncbi:MAG: outer membrane beta-barrel protein [Algiphilus sp.]
MKGHITSAIAILGASLAAAPAFAATDSIGHIDGYYIPSADIELGGGEDDGDGFGVKGRAQFADQLFLTGEYQAVEYDDSELEFDQLRGGVGFFAPLGPDVQWNARAELVRVELSVPGAGSDDETGFGVHGGLEAMLTPRFSVHGSIGYLSVDDADGPEFLVGGRFMASQNVSIFADYRMSRFEDDDTDLDVDDIRVGAGFHF